VSNFREVIWATIAGEVRRPGQYPIRRDTTTVAELVALAGGFTPQASLIGTTLRRVPVDITSLLSDVAQLPPELLTADDRALLAARGQQAVGTVVLDFEALFAQGHDALDTPLVHGDVIQVPRRRTEVAVIGAVRLPGMVPYRDGGTAAMFIRESGGTTDRANMRGAMVLNAARATRTPLRDAARIEPGDVIIVPFRQPVSWSDRIQTVGMLVGTATSLVLAWVAINR
jgi:protein involved in polysaccharide export with SLBB domain